MACSVPIATLALCLLVPLPASAGPITVPAGLNPGDQYRLTFVTSTMRDATSGNVGDYNTFVAAAANSVPELAALGATWKAAASPIGVMNARDNTDTNPAALGVPIYRLDAVKVAVSNPDLWDGSILAPINVNEFGAFNGTGNVWTGSLAFGIGGDNPLGRSVSDYGSSASVNGAWMDASHQLSTTHLSIYAMSDVLTVFSMPEPSTMVLACLAAVGLAVSSVRRRRHCNSAERHVRSAGPVTYQPSGAR